MNILNYNDETTLKEIKFSEEINYGPYKEHDLWYLPKFYFVLVIHL